MDMSGVLHNDWWPGDSCGITQEMNLFPLCDLYQSGRIDWLSARQMEFDKAGWQRTEEIWAGTICYQWLEARLTSQTVTSWIGNSVIDFLFCPSPPIGLCTWFTSSLCGSLFPVRPKSVRIRTPLLSMKHWRQYRLHNASVRASGWKQSELWESHNSTPPLLII